MIKRVVLILGGIVFSLALLVCSENPTIPEPTTLELLEERLAQTPRLNREAEEMALWVSKEIVAPQWLYEHCDSAVNRLRNQYDRGAPSGLNTTFFRMSPQPSDIWVFFDSASSAAISGGWYTAWDSLNDLYRVTFLKVHKTADSFKSMVNVKFTGRLNSDSLASYYDKLSGVEFAERSRGHTELPDRSLAKSSDTYINGSNLYPFIYEDQIRFLLHEAWGDCPAGCLINYLTYYREEVDSFRCLGSVFLSDTTDFPDWWYEEAAEIFCWHLLGHACDWDSFRPFSGHLPKRLEEGSYD